MTVDPLILLVQQRILLEEEKHLSRNALKNAVHDNSHVIAGAYHGNRDAKITIRTPGGTLVTSGRYITNAAIPPDTRIQATNEHGAVLTKIDNLPR